MKWRDVVWKFREIACISYNVWAVGYIFFFLFFFHRSMLRQDENSCAIPYRIENEHIYYIRTVYIWLGNNFLDLPLTFFVFHFFSPHFGGYVRASFVWIQTHTHIHTYSSHSAVLSHIDAYISSYGRI